MGLLGGMYISRVRELYESQIFKIMLIKGLKSGANVKRYTGELKVLVVHLENWRM